jgi:aminoglycoside/choline kinase family phosphotransferase
MPKDLRTLTLLDWLTHDLLLTVDHFQPASSDASFRRYFRVTTPDASLIVMDAPPDKENIRPFMSVAALMARAGVRVPAIYQHNLEDGFLLLEDFGSQSFWNAVHTGDPDSLYQRALDTLLLLQMRTDTATCALPRYDEALLARELGIFNDWFLAQLLDIELPDALLASVNAVLIDSALAQPTVCVHRDYHSRNLMVMDDGKLGVLDFQDAVLGPITYDVVSLLRDCYIVLPPQQVGQWLAQHYQRVQQAGLINCGLAQFKRWFDLMGLQRHLKVLGIFSRLHLRDGKSGYLQDLPRTLAYVMAIVGAYPELADFERHMLTRVLPAYARF